jgi:glycerol-3-phosphate dehydrogenase (NAD(P)+)
MERSRCIAVLGAGSWGTAIAVLLARNGHRVLLWGHDRKAMERLREAGRNTHYLPDAPFPQTLEPHWDLGEVLAASHAVFVVIPSHGFRQLLRLLAPDIRAGARFVSATKGLELGTGQPLHEIFVQELGESVIYAVLSGPSFAAEVARGLPTAVTVASRSSIFAREVAAWLRNETFRVYTSDDIIGVELGGALKNVLAIAAGISDGLGFGANARAALITRGLAEMMRLAEKAGAHRSTLMGLSGLGDLVLTCTDDQSRNRRLGLALGRGGTVSVAMRNIGQAVEGVGTAKVIRQVARARGVEMPICAEVYRIVHEQRDPRIAVTELFKRELKAETA